MNVPTRLPMLSEGKQEPGTNQVCAEQAVNWLVSGRLSLGDETDHPDCVQPVLNTLAINVNDLISDERREEMWPLILRQPGTAHPDMEPILSVRLACFLATKVLHLVKDGDREVCRLAIEAALTWCDDPSEKNRLSVAASADAAYADDYATYAAATHAAEGMDLIQLLSDTQDECERLTGHVPQEPDYERIERLAQIVGVR